MLFQAEYRWKIFPAVDAALFYDTGKVASGARTSPCGISRAITASGFDSVRSMASSFEIDAAFGGRDGAQLFIKFSDVFDGAF